MKPQIYILIFGILIFGCKSEKGEYEIINQTKIVNKENCKIQISFPKIKGIKSKEKLIKLNELLENIPEHEYYAKNCGKTETGKFKVKGEYEILLKTDSILSIEFRTLINREKQKTDTIYQSIVLNPNRKIKSEFYELLINIENVIPNFERGMIYPFIKKYSLENKLAINLLAYETGSNYAITWAITKDNIIFYTGGEGEMFGNNKIEIPLNKLKK